DEARATSIPFRGSVRSEQRSLAEKELPPEGLRRIWPVAALLVGHRSTSGYAPSSRLATGQIRRNERHRSYVHDHLASAQKLRYLLPWLGSLALVSSHATVRVIRESVGTMNIHHLELFYYVARHGGISEAVR